MECLEKNGINRQSFVKKYRHVLLNCWNDFFPSKYDPKYIALTYDHTIIENDYVFVDEDKLAAAITKKSLPSEQELEINRLIDQSFSQYEEMYKELANH